MSISSNLSTITVRHMLGGDLYVIAIPEGPEGQEIPTVASVRKQLYDHYIGENGRNESIHLFDEDGIAITDDQRLSLKNKEKNEIHLNMFIDHEKKMTAAETANVERTLHAFIDNGAANTFDTFKEAIISTGALVAGGSILSSFGDFTINDLDIYVNFSNGEILLNKLAQCGYKMPRYKDPQQASQYDQSFFHKNNIMARLYLLHENRNDHCRKNSIDVMIIPDGYSLENVVTNFDLSFCEIWWDGEATYASDPYGVRHKSGVLKPDYRCALFTDFNPFISSRIRKYRSRGFSVDTCLSDFQREYNNNEENKENKKELGKLDPITPHHTIRDEKAWATSLIAKEFYVVLRTLMRPLIQANQFSAYAIYFKIGDHATLLQRLGKENMDVLIRHVFRNTILCMAAPYKEIYRRVFHDDLILDEDEIEQDDIEQEEKLLQVMLSFMENELSDQHTREGVLAQYQLNILF